MRAPVWRVEDDGETQLPASTTAESGLVSLPFLVAAVRRRWRRIVATAGVCALLALGLTQVLGGQSSATMTLLLTNDPSADPGSATMTNLSLLHTRAVSQGVVDRLRLPLAPEAFSGAVTATQSSDRLMTLTVTAPTGQEAVRRVSALATVYLQFRARQLGALARATVDANQKRVSSLNRQIANLTKQYDAAAAAPGEEQVATALLTQRAQLQAEVSAAEQDIEQTKLESQAVNDASHVVDAASIIHTSRIKGAVLAVMSGVIGGTALGLCLVLGPAVLTTRLRRRDDVARALGLSVRFSAGPVRSRAWSMAGRVARRNAERLAHGLATALPSGAATARLTVATVGDVRDGAFVVGALADELAGESTSVAIVDLSMSGALANAPRRSVGGPDPLRNRQLVKVHRQDVRVSELASRTRLRLGPEKELSKVEVVLTLVELDLGAGIDGLGELAEASVVLVSAGSASAERLRSSATLLRQSDVHPLFAMLAGADDTDDSSGVLESRGQQRQPTRRSS